MKIILNNKKEIIVAEIWFEKTQLHYIDVDCKCSHVNISDVESIVHIEGGLPE